MLKSDIVCLERKGFRLKAVIHSVMLHADGQVGRAFLPDRVGQEWPTYLPAAPDTEDTEMQENTEKIAVTVTRSFSVSALESLAPNSRRTGPGDAAPATSRTFATLLLHNTLLSVE